MNWIKPIFIFSGLYDGILGLAFLLFGRAIFEKFGVPPPNHMGYIVFPALLLLLFAAMFFQIARDPAAHRDLMLYGIGLKMAYCGTAFWFEFNGGIPFMWIPWAWTDFLFLLLFLAAWRLTRPARTART